MKITKISINSMGLSWVYVFMRTDEEGFLVFDLRSRRAAVSVGLITIQLEGDEYDI